jgi:hypothetical protein
VREELEVVSWAIDETDLQASQRQRMILLTYCPAHSAARKCSLIFVVT